MPDEEGLPPGPTGLALDAAVATALRERLPDVAARTVAAVVAEVPEYADPLRGELGENITRAVGLALATFVRLAEEPPSMDPGPRVVPALEAAYALGRGEARSGRTMNALLSAYRVGARVAWEQWATLALEAGLDSRRLVPFASLVFAYIDQLSAASVNGHSDELATTGRVREQYRERLARALILGADLDELEQRAERAGWPIPRTLTCVLGSSAHTAGIRAQLDSTTLSLASDAVDPAGPTDLVVHLVPDIGARRHRLLNTLGSRALACGPERPWPEAHRSYQRAMRGWQQLGATGHVIDTEKHLADLVLTADMEALADLRAQALQPLSNLKPDAADRLAQTLLSWLLHQGRREDVATALVVHPQTVRYRMTQLRELYGDRLRDPAVVRDLIVGLTEVRARGSGDA